MQRLKSCKLSRLAGCGLCILWSSKHNEAKRSPFWKTSVAAGAFSTEVTHWRHQLAAVLPQSKPPCSTAQKHRDTSNGFVGCSVNRRLHAHMTARCVHMISAKDVPSISELEQEERQDGRHRNSRDTAYEGKRPYTRQKVPSPLTAYVCLQLKVRRKPGWKSAGKNKCSDCCQQPLTQRNLIATESLNECDTVTKLKAFWLRFKAAPLGFPAEP